MYTNFYHDFHLYLLRSFHNHFTKMFHWLQLVHFSVLSLLIIQQFTATIVLTECATLIWASGAETQAAFNQAVILYSQQGTQDKIESILSQFPSPTVEWVELLAKACLCMFLCGISRPTDSIPAIPQTFREESKEGVTLPKE